MISYKEVVKDYGHLDFNNIKRVLPSIKTKNPKIGLILKKYKNTDFINAINIIKQISTFEWCSNKKAIIKLKEEMNQIITEVNDGVSQDDININLSLFNPDYILKNRAIYWIKNAFLLLKYLEII